MKIFRNYEAFTKWIDKNEYCETIDLKYSYHHLCDDNMAIGKVMNQHDVLIGISIYYYSTSYKSDNTIKVAFYPRYPNKIHNNDIEKPTSIIKSWMYMLLDKVGINEKQR